MQTLKQDRKVFEYTHLIALFALLNCLLTTPAWAKMQALTVDESNQQLRIPLAFGEGDGLGEGGNFGEGELAVELDGYDVSLFATIEDNALVLRLDTPLPEGNHMINIMIFLPDGEIATLADQSFTVQPLSMDLTDWQLNTTFVTNYRIDEKVPAGTLQERHLTGQGSAAFSAEHRSGNWQLTADFEALYDTTSENHPHNESWALPKYYLSTAYDGDGYTSQVGMGNIRMEREDLLFSAYQRRGIEASVVDEKRHIKVKLLGLKSEPETGYHLNTYLPNRRQERITGAIASVEMFEEYLQLSAGYLDGETSWGDSLVGGQDAVRYGGNSRNLALDSQWLGNSLWIRTEYARSTFDSDGVGIGEDAAEDHALQALVQLSSEGKLGGGYFDYWSALFQHQQVGADYYSLGNLSLPGDLALNRLNVKGRRGGLIMELTLSEEKNNLDNNPLLPTQSLTRVGSDITYTPMWINPERQLWKTIGMPTLMTRFYRSHHDQPDQDAAVYGFDLDNVTDEMGLTLTFSRNNFSWNIQYQLIDREENSQEVLLDEVVVYTPPSDNKNRLIGLSASWFQSERLSLNTSLQWNKQSESDFSNHYRYRNFSIGAQAQLMPSLLSLIVNYNYGKNTSQFNDDFYIEDNFRSDFVNGQLTWHVREGKGKRLGINAFIKGSYGHQNNRAFSQTTETWAGLVGVETYWNTGARL